MGTLWNRDPAIRLRHLILAISVALLFPWLVPIMQVRLSGDGQASDRRIQRENDYRNSRAQAFGILGGVILIFLALKRIGLAQEGQITERFSKAIDHLGATNKDGGRILEVRLGGIYALERIARDSKQDHQAVMEVLTAYLRENAAWNSEKEEAVEYFESMGIPPTRPRASADIQAIVTVLGRRTLSHEERRIRGFVDLRTTDTGLDLRKTDLRWVEVFSLPLQKAILKGAHLSHALLPGADFSGANLEGANLFKAQLTAATFYNANLKGAWLHETNLVDANFQQGDLSRANLQNGFLGGANFQKALLVDAVLSGANIQGRASFSHADLRSANFDSAKLMYADFQAANLNCTVFLDADLTGANLIASLNLTVDQLCQTRSLCDTKIDPSIEKQLKEKHPSLFDRKTAKAVSS